MVGKSWVLRATATGALTLSFTIPAPAQDSGVEMTLGFGQRFEINDNLDLDPDSAGTTSLATTTLSFGLLSETGVDRLELSASTALRVRSGPGVSGVDTFFDDQRLGFGYAREGADANFAIDARYRRSEVEFLRPLEDFLNEEGEIELPEDAADLEGSGTRLSYGLDTTLEWGVDTPLGVVLSAGLSGLDYTGVTDPDLADNRRSRAGAGLRLQFSPVARGALDLTYSTFAAEDAESTRRERSGAEVSVLYELSPITRLDGGIGYSAIDTEEFGVTSREEGPTARLGLERDMPNGTLSADLSSEVTEDGNRYTLNFGRALDLPTGALAGSLGVTGLEGGDPQTIAGLSWRRDLPTGTLYTELKRSVTLDAQDDEELTTALAVRYSYDINSVSGVDLSLTYASADETGPDNRVDSASFTAAYRRALTPEWDLSAGYTYRSKDEQGVGRASSNTVFLGLSRDFSLRP